MTMLKSLAVMLFALLSINEAGAQCQSGNCINGKGTYLFESGATYTGEFVGGKMQGQGTLRFTNGNVFIGTFKQQYREGFGKMKYANGDFFEGTYAKSKPVKGKMSYVNKHIYDGEWLDDVPNGHGTYTFPTGEVYVGNMLHAKFEGQGRMTFPNKSYYDGAWKNNLRHGEGLTVQTDGTKQRGTWINGEFRGATATTKPNTGVASSNNNRPNTATAAATAKPNASNKPVVVPTRQSTAPAAKPQEDISKLPNCNEVYCRQGRGIFTYDDGSRWVGDIIDGMPEGSGILKYSNGDRYEGQFADHAPHGEGVMYYANGRVYGALWSEGRPVGKLAPKQQMSTDKVSIEQSNQVKIWAVVVGVATYEHMPTLNYTDDDAYQVYSFLKSAEGGALPDNQVKLLVESQATRESILAALRQQMLRADENDVVFFYFSGHGIPGSFLPIDYDGYNNQILHSEVRDLLQQSRAKHKICIADACYSGSIMARKDGSLDNAQLAQKFYGAFEKATGGVALLMSSKSEEYSLEDQGLRSGVFSYYLIKGLKGIADLDHDKIVTVQELYNYVGKAVRDYTGGVQNPVLTGEYNPRMPVAAVR